MLNLVVRLVDAPLALFFSEAYDVTFRRQIAFYTPLMQFGKVVLSGNAVFLIDFAVFLFQFPDGFFFLLLGAAFIEGLESFLQPLLFLVNGLLRFCGGWSTFDPLGGNAARWRRLGIVNFAGFIRPLVNVSECGGLQ